MPGWAVLVIYLLFLMVLGYLTLGNLANKRYFASFVSGTLLVVFAIILISIFVKSYHETFG